VAAIGLAGENRVYYASIEQGRSSASRGGIGAVMGDKGFKAIVVRGTKTSTSPGRQNLWSCATRCWNI
jgi:benzoyl-CoA reductase subunit BamB